MLGLTRQKSNQAIHQQAPDWLQIAMELSLTTLQSRAEVINMRFADLRDGWLYVIRDKVATESEMAFIATQVSSHLNEIINRARNDNVVSPYIVHFTPQSKRRTHLENKPHWIYVNPQYLSKEFKKVRDATGEYADLAPQERPTFNEIRSLGARVYLEMGFSKEYVQYLMTHSDQDYRHLFVQPCGTHGRAF